MADVIWTPGPGWGAIGNTKLRDQGDGTLAEQFASLNYYWDTSQLTWVKAQADPTTGAIRVAVVNEATSQGKTLLFAAIDVASAGDNTLVAADATNKIKVASYVIIADGAVTVRWKSGAGTNLSGAMSIAATGGTAMAGQASSHLLETAVNAALVLNLGGAVGVRGHLSYFKEP